jgi:hypothetical protein
MDEECQLEQTDLKRMRSISVVIRCEIKWRSSLGSSDRSDFNAAMDDAADLLLLLDFLF